MTPLEARQLLDGSGLSATWIGQDRHDYVGPSSLVAPSDVQDIHIAINGLPADRTVTFADIQGFGGSEWQYHGNWGPWAAQIFKAAGATSADLYIEPDRQETGRPFFIHLQYDDGSTADVSLGGGVADPNLRMPDAALQVQWDGQDGSDRVGVGPGVGPDGRQDLHLALANLSANVPINEILVTSSDGVKWRTGVNQTADNNAELVRHADDGSKADLFLQAPEDLAGQTLTLTVNYGNGKVDTATINAAHVDPALTVAPPAPMPAINRSISARWIGQDGLNQIGPGDVHLTVAGIPAGRSIVAAALSDPADALWSYRQGNQAAFYSDLYAAPLGVRPGADPTTADLAFPPSRDESGSVLTLRLLLDDGTTAIAQFPGGKADPGLRVPGPDASSVVAQTGDDLNDLANRFGDVRLTAGTYYLSRPLVLNHPVTIHADPGATLVFSQGASDPTWAAAIKINASHTTLDGFAVRFATPIRWTPGVNYGPAVIGTTDNFDNAPDDPKIGINLTHLDLQSPPASSDWEEAPRLIRLASAQSGVVSGNTLKGGMTEFLGGPWTITDNTYLGTVPGTYSFGVFAGHRTHDVTIAGNTASQSGPSGKTWRFLVLTESGYNDVVRDNTVTGIGPRDNDTVPANNAPEIILTESYSLRFEGHPLAVSPDGLIVQIPSPQGDTPRTGDAVAILSGPAKGQWRRVVQVLSPTTLLLDSPLPQGDYAISIAGGFVGETFQGNTIDARGSSVAVDMFLAGNHFGTKVLDNHFLGGGGALRMTAAPSENPVQWGWTHAPVMGAVVSGNTFEDVNLGATFEVEHSPAIKSDKGRVYLSAAIDDNTVKWSDAFLAAHPDAPAITIGADGSLDPGELVATMSGNVLAVSPGAKVGNPLWVRSATVNGQELVDQQLPMPQAGPAAPTGLALINDTGASATDGLTRDGRIRFNSVAGAFGYEYRVGDTGVYRPVPSPNGFLPAGLVEGKDTISVRAFDSAGNRGPAAAFTFTYDTFAPADDAPVLQSASDTGLSNRDGLTRATAPVFSASGDPTDVLTLYRNGVAIDRRTGPGTLQGPGVSGDGVYFYAVRRTDPAGNFSTSPPVRLVIDTTPPPAVSGLERNADGRVSFRPTAPGDVYEYRVNGASTYTPIGTANAFTPTGLTAGANTIAVHAIDLAGNVGPDATIILAAPAPVGVWLGQDGHDFVGPSPLPVPDGMQDIHIALANLPADRTIVFADIQGFGGGDWQYQGAWGPWSAAIVRAQGSSSADLYLQPYQVETGRPFYVTLRFDNGTTASFWVGGGAADPALRVPSGPVGIRSLSQTVPGSPTPAGTISTPAPQRHQKPAPRRRAHPIAPTIGQRWHRNHLRTIGRRR